MRALCLMHDAHSSAGLVGDALRARGWLVDELVVVPAETHHAPDIDFSHPAHSDYDLLVPMGAPWSAYDERGIGRWLKPELRWLSDCIADGGAVLGVCFGAQALARALGGAVTRMADPEIGWVRVDSDDPELIEPGPWFQWHFDAFTVPPGAVRLAWNQAAPQAYRVGRSLGVQFHPEITAPGIEKWLDNGGESEARAHGVDPAALVAEARSQEAASRVRADSLIEKYLVKIFAG